MRENTREIYTTKTCSQKQELHKYVSICLGCLLLALATFPLAYWRVSRSGKYNAGAFNSLSSEQSQKSEFDR